MRKTETERETASPDASHQKKIQPGSNHTWVLFAADANSSDGRQFIIWQTTNLAPFWNLRELHAMTVIEIKPHRWNWKVFEAPGVESVFLEKRQAINFAQSRASCRRGEIRVLDSNREEPKAVTAQKRLRLRLCFNRGGCVVEDAG